LPPETEDPAGGWTWDQTRDLWRKLAEKNAGNSSPAVWPLAPSVFGPGGPGSNYWYEGAFIRSFGDAKAGKDTTSYKTFQAVSDDGLKVTGYIDTPEAIAGMDFYQSIFTEKFSPLVGIPNSWYDGKAATFLGGDTTAVRASQLNVKFEWTATPMPKGKTQFTHGSAQGFLVSSQSKYRNEAAALVGLMHNDANRIAWANVRGTLPARLSLYAQLPRYREYPFNLALNTLKSIAYPPPLTPGGAEYQAAMNIAIKDIATGAKPADRLPRVAKEIDEQLKKYT
jgi:multiple sugar transport system substrate-binding protein